MRKIVFILLAVVICFSPVGVSSQNIFQKAANKISSWFLGGEKERASDKTGHIDITQLTLDENLSIPDLGKQARKIRTAQSREMKRLQKARFCTTVASGSSSIVNTSLFSLGCPI